MGTCFLNRKYVPMILFAHDLYCIADKLVISTYYNLYIRMNPTMIITKRMLE